MDDARIDASEENPPRLPSENQEESRLLARQAIGLVRDYMQEEDVPDLVEDQSMASVRQLRSVLRSRLSSNPTYEMFWKWFQREPDANTASLIGSLSALMEDDPKFKNKLATLLQRYRDARGDLQQAQRDTTVITEEKEES